LYPHMSVYDNMAFGLKLRKTPKVDIDRRVKEAADILDIGHLLDRKPKQLSGGQRQRVAVGRAIVREPAVFLFDEPLSNLDAKLRVQTRAQLTRLHQRLATTFIYVTHDQVEAMTMATRIAVMKDGILQQIDTPQQLYKHPRNVFVAGFIGSPSMNFFDATLVENNGKLEVNTGGFRMEVPDAKAKEWRAHKGREVIFGIRPDDIHAKPFVPPGILESSLSARVDVTELMGNEIFLYLVTKDDKQFVARVDPRVQATMGDQMDLAVDMGNAHIFDPKTETSLID
ncbi:MAG: ATP-binding cassette domain-containing protein, partial [Chloroflexota bacterium]|nr:ATP-binding cassette domain-containing protein [Chloroflexota bacterium]